MVVDVVKGNVFSSSLHSVVFAMNDDGANTDGFAGLVTGKCCPTGFVEEAFPLGTIVSLENDGKKFLGIVCHSLCQGGWSKTPQIVTSGLDLIEVQPDEKIAVVLMGAGLAGAVYGADVPAIVRAIHASKLQCVIYTLDYTKEQVFACLQ